MTNENKWIDHNENISKAALRRKDTNNDINYAATYL